MNRRLCSVIPTTTAQLQPRILDPNKIRKKLQLKQEKQKSYYDQHAKHLPKLWKGDRIRVLMNFFFKHGMVISEANTPRSYQIKTDDGGEYRRNRRMLIKSQEIPPVSYDLFREEPNSVTIPGPKSNTTNLQPVSETVAATSPGDIHASSGARDSQRNLSWTSRTTNNLKWKSY